MIFISLNHRTDKTWMKWKEKLQDTIMIKKIISCYWAKQRQRLHFTWFYNWISEFSGIIWIFPYIFFKYKYKIFSYNHFPLTFYDDKFVFSIYLYTKMDKKQWNYSFLLSLITYMIYFLKIILNIDI